MRQLFRAQPRALSMIFMLEIWERFGFYTMQGILTLFFIRRLGLDDTTAYYTFGAFSALIYGMVVGGGYLGDRVLGTKRTIVLGLIVLMLGYTWLAWSNINHVYYALGLICIGNGIFKANPANLLSKCYEKNDSRLYSGYTLYYMAVNLGSIFALLAGPSISSHYGYSYAFFLSAIGLGLGLINYACRRQSIAMIQTPMDEKRVPWWQWVLLFISIIAGTWIAAQLLQHVHQAKKIVWLITALVVGTYLYRMQSQDTYTKRRMGVILILMLEAVVFFTLYQQMPTSLTLFAVDNVRPYLFGIPIDPQSFQVLNASWIILMSPLLAFLYQHLQRRNISFPVPYKFTIGMFFCSLSFLILFVARYFANEAGLVHSGWLVTSYFFQSLGELLISALGVAMVAELAPAEMAGFVMGMWFLTSSITGFTGALVASFTALPHNLTPGPDSLLIYTRVFGEIGLVTLIISGFLWKISPQLRRMMQLTVELDKKLN